MCREGKLAARRWGWEFLSWVRRDVFWCMETGHKHFILMGGEVEKGAEVQPGWCGEGATGGLSFLYLFSHGNRRHGISWKEGWEKAWRCEEKGEGVM